MSEIELNDCEKEQLHLSGQIQSFGALIGFSKTDLTVSHASENIETFLGKSAVDLFGTKIADISEQLSMIVAELEFDDMNRFVTRNIMPISMGHSN